MSQRSQIEWLKFSRLRNKPLITCTDQCEYYCFHIFCSFLSFDSHGPSSGPYEIIVIFYFLSGNLMLVISWRKFGRRDQERRLAQSSGTSLRRGLTACVRTATGVLRKRPVSQHTSPPSLPGRVGRTTQERKIRDQLAATNAVPIQIKITPTQRSRVIFSFRISHAAKARSTLSSPSKGYR